MRHHATSKVVVDRVEGDRAVLVLYRDDAVRFVLPLSCLPAGTKGGDHLLVTFAQDNESRESERAKAERLLKELSESSQS